MRRMPLQTLPRGLLESPFASTVGADSYGVLSDMTT